MLAAVLVCCSSFRSPMQSRFLHLRQHRAEKQRLHGIPKMFRWLVDLYPSVTAGVQGGDSFRTECVDNFYLDM